MERSREKSGQLRVAGKNHCCTKGRFEWSAIVKLQTLLVLVLDIEIISIEKCGKPVAECQQ